MEQPVRPQKHIDFREKVGQIKTVLGQFRVGCIASCSELLVGTQFVELAQGDDRVNVLRSLMPGFVRRESQRKRGASVERHLQRMAEVAIQRPEYGERIIHGALATGQAHTHRALAPAGRQTASNAEEHPRGAGAVGEVAAAMSPKVPRSRPPAHMRWRCARGPSPPAPSWPGAQGAVDPPGARKVVEPPRG